MIVAGAFANCETAMIQLNHSKRYISPKLTYFGKFSRLTAAGSGRTGENTMSTNPNRRPWSG